LNFLAYDFDIWNYSYVPRFIENLLVNLVQYIQYKPLG